MPFVSSVRSNYGNVGREASTNTGWLASISGGTVTTAGGYRIHSYTSQGTSNNFPAGGAVQRPINVEIYAWGAAGGSANGTGWGYWSLGGGGGFAGGNLVLSSLKSYVVAVGDAGGVASGTGFRSATGGGGGTSWGNGNGGGLSGIFDTSYTHGNSILIAGGGGGGGSSRGNGSRQNDGGGGGGTVGQNGEAYQYSSTFSQGGTQSAGGNSQIQGATLASGPLVGGTSDPHSAGGGGGYYGGGTGGYTEPDTMAGGGGGSGYVHPSLLTNTTLTQANREVAANTGSALYPGSVGNHPGGNNVSGQRGHVIIRYLI